MRREASTLLEKPASLGLGEGLLTPVRQHLFLKQVCVFNGGTPEESLPTQKHWFMAGGAGVVHALKENKGLKSEGDEES